MAKLRIPEGLVVDYTDDGWDEFKKWLDGTYAYLFYAWVDEGEAYSIAAPDGNVCRIFSINKADGENLEAAERARAELEHALAILRPRGDDVWTPRVVTSSGLTGDGLDEIWTIIEEHHAVESDNGALERRRQRQLLGWMWSLVDEGLRSAVHEHPQVAATLADLENDVLEGRTTPTAAAENILSTFRI